MSVSLITGIGEKVSPSRLTTPRGGCVGGCALVFAKVRVYLSAYRNVYLCVSYSYLRLSMKR